jgi:MoxR-like ATPase
MEILSAAYERFSNLLPLLERGLPERETALRLAVCAALAGESVFLYGPPGTAKSMVARRLQCAFKDAKAFDYLLCRFSTPEEIFGPLSIARLRDEDRYERRYAGFLPDADIVFLDEVWKAGPPIQNALLTALNEKIWRNGDQEIHLPLKCLIGASNELSSDDSSEAFWDRFLVRIPLSPLSDPAHFTAMIEDQSDVVSDPVPPSMKISPQEWTEWQAAIRTIPLGKQVSDFLWQLRARLPLSLGTIGPSDRRWKKIVGLLRSSAFMHGRQFISLADLAVLPFCLWNTVAQWPQVLDVCHDAIARIWCAEAQELVRIEADSNLLSNEIARQDALDTPKVVDEEYFLIEAPDLLSPGQELRIWMNDFHELSQASPHQVDVFIYQGASLVQSLVLELSLGNSPWSLVHAGQNLSLILGLPKKNELGSSVDRLEIPKVEDIKKQFADELKRREQAEITLRQSWFQTLDPVRLFGPWDNRLSKIAELCAGFSPGL